MEHPKLVVSLLEVEIMLGIDLCLRSARFKSLFYLIPAFDSKVDHILSYWGFAPLYEFDSKHHPKLFYISDRIRQRLQDPNADQELIAAYCRVLNRMHMVKPDTFHKQTINGIRKRFTDHWPDIRPLEKASCLTVEERNIGIVWGEVRPGQLSLWINPYLVQALEAAEAVSFDDHLLYTSQCSNSRAQISKHT